MYFTNPFNRCSKLLVVVAFMLLLNPAASVAAQNPLAMSLVFQRSLPSILSITVRDHKGQLRRGSGFFVNDNGLFITAFNVVENAQRITVRTEEGWIYTVNDVVALAKEQDLALLRVPLVKTRPIELRKADNPAKPGEAAVVVASSGGLGWHVADGRISQPPGNAPGQANSDWLYFTAKVIEGNQGGPLVDQYGRLLGVVLPPDGTEVEQPVHKAVALHHVRELMARLVTLPLSATWTVQPKPPEPPVELATQAPSNKKKDKDASVEKSAEEALAEALAQEEQSEAQAQPPDPPAHLETQALGSDGGAGTAQHIAQARRLYWQTVPGDLEPGRVCPPMISLHLRDEFGIRTVVQRSNADAGMNLSGRVDTGKECNMWGCFDGYRLFMNFSITNSQGRVLFRDYFEVDEDDVMEACEELAEDIVDELEDLLD